MVCNTTVQKTGLFKKQAMNIFLAQVTIPSVWFWFLSAIGVKGKYMLQALGVIKGSKAEKHPEPQPMLQSRN